MRPPRLHRLAREVTTDGGIPARRAVARWAWRLFRREWRQQLLVLALLTVAVAAAVASASVAYNLASSSDARFGGADHLLTYSGADPRTQGRVAAAAEWFGTIDVIGRRFVPVPGSVESVEFRSQDPRGAYSAPMLALREGRYPTRADQVALTNAVASTFQLGVGDPFALDGHHRTVVGLVENPNDLGDEFVLVAPSDDDRPESMTILLRASGERFDAFREANGSPPVFESRGRSEQATAAAGTFGLATVALLLVSLVAAAGFTVVAQRRLRQLGMLAAIGATQKHLRLVLLANGAMVGAIAAVVGTSAGLVGWIAVAPLVETAAGHRIDRLDVPWWLLGTGMLLAVVTATAAAWWPARAVARIPVTLALSARPARPKPAHRSALVAGLLVVTGVVCLVLADQTSPPLIVMGTVATALGILLVSPLAIRALAASGARSPVAARLALRDLARHQARSGAALAAISLAVGIAVAVVIIAAAAEDTADEGNLSDSQLLIRMGRPAPLVPVRTPAELESLQAQVDRLAAALDHPSVIALDMAVDPAAHPEPGSEGSEGGRPAVELGQPIDDHTSSSYPLYVATPDLLERFGVDPGAVDPDTDVLTAQTGDDFELVNIPERGTRVNVETIDGPAYSSLPTSVITPAALHRGGWRPARAAWFVETDRPLTSAQLATARQLAADAGLTIEARRDQTSLLVLRAGATAAGMLLALGVLAMTVGLIRGEAAGDLRTLTATGATSRTRRTLTATTAGALALLGALLGIAGAYLALTAGYRSDLNSLGRVPVLDLTITAVGLPLLAALAGWLLAGREPPSIARQPLQ
jgi:putative ABC transport system permease protein